VGRDSSEEHFKNPAETQPTWPVATPLTSRGPHPDVGGQDQQALADRTYQTGPVYFGCFFDASSKKQVMRERRNI